MARKQKPKKSARPIYDAVKHLERAAHHLQRFAGVVESVFRREVGSRRRFDYRDHEGAAIDPWNTLGIVWEAIECLDAAVKAFGILDENGRPAPSDRVGMWFGWISYTLPTVKRDEARDTLYLAKAVHSWYDNERKPVEGADGTVHVEIPLFTASWAVGVALQARVTAARLRGDTDGRAHAALLAHVDASTDKARQVDGSDLGKELSEIAREVRRLPSHNTSPAERFQLGGRLVEQALKLGAFDSSERIGWKTAIELRLALPLEKGGPDPHISAWAELAYRVRLDRGLPTHDVVLEEYELIATVIETAESVPQSRVGVVQSPSGEDGSGSTASDLTVTSAKNLKKRRRGRAVRMNVSKRLLTIDGTTVKISPDRLAVIVGHLVDADGDWVSGAELVLRPGERVDRMLDRLPQTVRQRITGLPGKGYRIDMD